VRYFLFLITLVFFASCASYKSNILLKASQSEIPEILKAETVGIEREYIIQKNDQLSLEIYLYNGERLVDPTPQAGANSPTGTSTSGQKGENNQTNYEVSNNGLVKFPMIGEMKLEGLSLRQAEEIIRKAYTNYFKEPFVQLSFVNKRVIILGAPGGQVIPLKNSNMRLPEIIALAKGINNDGRANNIRLVRNEHVYQFDLTTLKGFKEGNIIIEPGDIVYVEPVRRPFTEGIRDNYFIASMLLALITLATLLKK
jgi:polysaccharide export outer membrane protein